MRYDLVDDMVVLVSRILFLHPRSSVGQFRFGGSERQQITEVSISFRDRLIR